MPKVLSNTRLRYRLMTFQPRVLATKSTIEAVKHSEISRKVSNGV